MARRREVRERPVAFKYRLGRFIAQHMWICTAVIVVLIGLVVGSIYWFMPSRTSNLGIRSQNEVVPKPTQSTSVASTTLSKTFDQRLQGAREFLRSLADQGNTTAADVLYREKQVQLRYVEIPNLGVNLGISYPHNNNPNLIGVNNGNYRYSPETLAMLISYPITVAYLQQVQKVNDCYKLTSSGLLAQVGIWEFLYPEKKPEIEGDFDYTFNFLLDVKKQNLIDGHVLVFSCAHQVPRSRY